MRRYALILIGFLCLMCQYTLAQISEGGKPISFSLNLADTRTDRMPVLIMPSVDVKSLHEEDAKTRANGMENEPKPFRFGYAIDVDIDIKRDGIRTELPDGSNLWMLKIHSSDAYSINLIFSNFRLAEGSKFFVYNEDRTMILGAFTPEVSNNPYNEFATDLIQGNSIILEYYEPKLPNDGVINVSKVIHGYIDTFSDFSTGLGASADCNIDANCPLGNNWINEKRAVSMVLLAENTAFCTGCLVNNTQQDFKPYYLTANHCYFDSNGTLTQNPSTNIFRFRYWRPNCSSGNPSNWVSVVGATIRANYETTDFALLELKMRPPVDYNVYYAGWDRTATPAQNTTAIHHPRGDAMKISHDADSAVAVPWQYHYTGALTYWRATFDYGIVQHGSSGSPLFNQNHKIIGQLRGRQGNQCGSHTSDNACHCSQTPIGEYGRFDLSWIGGGTDDSRLSNWLDPNNTGVSVLDGSCELAVDFSNNYTLYIYADITFYSCGDFNVYNLIVTNGAVLTLEAAGDINVQNVKVQNGAKLILDAVGEVNIISDFEVELGSEFEIK